MTDDAPAPGGQTAWQWVTSGLYLAAAILSLVLSRKGSSFTTVCVVTAAVFVIGVVWAVSRPTVAESSELSWSALLNLALGGLALVFFELWRGSHQWIGYVAVTLVYLGFAGIVARFRSRVQSRLAGLILIGLGVASRYVGLPLLGHIKNPWALLIIGVAVALLLAGADLASHWSPAAPAPGAALAPPSPYGIYIFAAEVAVAIGSAVTLGILAGSFRLAVVLIAAIALLSLAYVSRAPVDVVVVVALIALFGSTRLEASLPGPDHSPNKSVLLALGDSYTSGEGARTFYAGTDQAGGNQCRRSPTAYAAQIPAANIGFTSVDFLACSGAVTSEIYRTAQGGTTGSQLSQYQALGSPPVKLVLIGIGGNDAGFSHIGQACLAPGGCAKKMRTMFLDNLNVVEQNIADALIAVHNAVPGVPVVAVPYPAPFAATTGSCGGILLKSSERSFLSDFLADLDQELHVAAAATGTYYLDAMQHSLADANLQLCEPRPTVHHCPLGFSAKTGLNFVHLLSVTGYAAQRFNPANWIHDSLHPNPCGHAAELATFNAWYAANGSKLVANPPLATLSGPSDVHPAEATCDLANSPKVEREKAAEALTGGTTPITTCESKATAWAMQQLGSAGLYLFALLLLLAVSLGRLWLRPIHRLEPDQSTVARFTGSAVLVLAAVTVLTVI
ncbi:MAG: GDSL-type esterase/lipase family protein [Mycobacteriales bacterium]